MTKINNGKGILKFMPWFKRTDGTESEYDSIHDGLPTFPPKHLTPDHLNSSMHEY